MKEKRRVHQDKAQRENEWKGKQKEGRAKSRGNGERNDCED
jgi:hypothetical protein